MRYSARAVGHLRQLPNLSDAIRDRHRELEVPDAAATLGEPCKGKLRRCRKLTVARWYRMVYLVRPTDVVVLAVWYRTDLAAYDEARRALGEPLPTGLTP